MASLTHHAYTFQGSPYPLASCFSNIFGVGVNSGITVSLAKLNYKLDKRIIYNGNMSILS